MCTPQCVPVTWSCVTWPAISRYSWEPDSGSSVTPKATSRARTLSRSTTAGSSSADCFGSGARRNYSQGPERGGKLTWGGRVFGARSSQDGAQQPVVLPEPEALSVSLRPQATQLLEELENLVTKHKQELSTCFDNWLQRLDDPPRSTQAKDQSQGSTRHSPLLQLKDQAEPGLHRGCNRHHTHSSHHSHQHHRRAPINDPNRPPAWTNTHPANHRKPHHTPQHHSAQATPQGNADTESDSAGTPENFYELQGGSDLAEVADWAREDTREHSKHSNNHNGAVVTFENIHFDSLHGEAVEKKPSSQSGQGGHNMSTRRSQSLAHEIAKHKKKKKRLAKPFQELLASRVSMATSNQSCLQRLFSSRWYEWASATLILSNAVFIGCQTQFYAVRAMQDAEINIPQRTNTPPLLIVFQVIFTSLFSLELVLRWACDGFLEFFGDLDRWWNCLDVSVVFVSVMDLLLEYLMESQAGAVQNLNVLRVLRVVRIVRVARVIRIMKFFRELRMMIYSILGSMKSLLWVILVLVMTLFMFGITFTSATTAELDSTAKWQMQDSEELRIHFGSVDRSLLSLFMAMSGGDDWGRCYEALSLLSAPYRYLFLLFISFAIFAVVNIVTGIFVETALQSNNKDREIVVHEELEAKKAYLKSLREVFDEMDEDDSGSISLEEFEAKLDDERVIAYFNALKLDVSDARTLFWLLDYDHSNEVSIDEFLTGCYKLQGESRSLDMKLMQCEMHSLREGFDIMTAMLKDILATVRDSSSESSEAEE